MQTHLICLQTGLLRSMPYASLYSPEPHHVHGKYLPDTAGRNRACPVCPFHTPCLRHTHTAPVLHTHQAKNSYSSTWQRTELWGTVQWVWGCQHNLFQAQNQRTYSLPIRMLNTPLFIFPQASTTSGSTGYKSIFLLSTHIDKRTFLIR